MADDWYRNTEWNESIERTFNEKMKRARRKESYLRIQASMLARSHPQVALNLLDRYFELPDDFDHAQAHVDRAKALLTLGRLSEAIAAYELALAREAEFPRLQTEAYLQLPYLITTHGLTDQYPRALEVLRQHESRLTFRVDHFRWNAARALIAIDAQDTEGATVHAQRALEAAAREHSGFRYHPSVGLVAEQYDGIVKRLEALLG